MRNNSVCFNTRKVWVALKSEECGPGLQPKGLQRSRNRELSMCSVKCRELVITTCTAKFAVYE